MMSYEVTGSMGATPGMPLTDPTRARSVDTRASRLARAPRVSLIGLVLTLLACSSDAVAAASSSM